MLQIGVAPRSDTPVSADGTSQHLSWRKENVPTLKTRKARREAQDLSRSSVFLFLETQLRDKGDKPHVRAVIPRNPSKLR